MNNTKQIIERNLPFDQKYIYMSITRGSIESGQLTYCDNCGKLITNMVTVKNKETLKSYTIGTDCAETLSKAKCLYNNGIQTDFYVDIYAYNKAARFATEIRKGKQYTETGWQLNIETDKGKLIDVMKFDLEKFFPELIQKLT